MLEKNDSANKKKCDLSIVIPLYNEEDSLIQLHSKLSLALEKIGRSYEIIFVNDGSSDESSSVIEEILNKDSKVTLVNFRRNFGKAAALDAGFKRSRGKVVFTMDADLQDDPKEIKNFLNKIEQENFDVVSGYKKVRNDPSISKVLPSRIFNFVVSFISGLKLHDFNCGFKAYRAEALENLQIYGELHRYIPVLLFWQGFKITEIVVEHHKRQFGVSKYGFERMAKGAFDLLTVVLNTRYKSRPLHLFGIIGGCLGTIGFFILLYLSILWFWGYGPIGNRPLLFLGLLLVMVGIQIVSTGLLGELISRSQHSSLQNYLIKDVMNKSQNQD